MPSAQPPFPFASIYHRLLSILIGLSVITPNLSGAAPLNGVVTGGDASITVSGDNTAINQTTDRLSIDWDSFNISADERVEFLQPGQNSIALNRILSNDSSQIFGQIDANGHVILMNPNGVIFGEGAEVNVGGLIASGLNIDATEFMNGDLVFDALESGDGVVINRGLINAASGGNVALLGRRVANEGLVSANLGTVSLASGDQAVLTFDDAGMLGVRITEETVRELGGDALVSNAGEIMAAGGRVLLTSKTSQDIFSGAVNTDLPESEVGVEVHEDGSFTLSGTADVVNTGTIDVSSRESRFGSVDIRGSYIEHSGSLLVHVEEYDAQFSNAVTLSASDGVFINNGQISDPWEGQENESYWSGSNVIISGKYINVTGSEITVGPDRTVIIGDRLETRRVFIDDAVIRAAASDYDEVTSGGDIVIAADTSVVVAAELNVAGTTYDYRENESTGGDVLLDSGGRLALSGQVLNGSGNEYQSSFGELVIAAETLVIADNGEPFTISPATLEAIGTTRLQAVRSLRAEGAPEFTLSNHFSAEATGNEDGDPGVIDLRGMLLDSIYPQHGRSSLTISMEADSIVAPQIGVHHSLTGTRPRGVDVELTASTGDIVHYADVNTWTGEYRADAAGDVRFEGGAQLNTETYEEYPEGWGNGPIHISAGGDIALTLDNERPQAYGKPWLDLSGSNVYLSLANGSLQDGSFNLITAENLTVNSAGDFSAEAFVSGHTSLVAPAGGEWLMEGDFNTLSVEAEDAISLTLNDANDLVMGDMVYANGSDVALVADSDAGTLSQMADSRIELSGSHLGLVADKIHLGADGTAQIIMTGADRSTIEGDFISSLSLNDAIESGGPVDLVVFRGADTTSAQVMIGEHATFVNFPSAVGSIQLGSGDDTVDLAADLPLEMLLGEGADVINLQAADLNYNLIDFDESLDTINPYVAPPPPTDGGPKPWPKPGHWPKPHHWGMPFWAYPHWYWKPGFPGYRPWGVHNRQKPGNHSFHWQPWFPPTFARQ